MHGSEAICSRAERSGGGGASSICRRCGSTRADTVWQVRKTAALGRRWEADGPGALAAPAGIRAGGRRAIFVPTATLAVMHVNRHWVAREIHAHCCDGIMKHSWRRPRCRSAARASAQQTAACAETRAPAAVLAAFAARRSVGRATRFVGAALRWGAAHRSAGPTRRTGRRHALARFPASAVAESCRRTEHS
jgi:hypothetical protein